MNEKIGAAHDPAQMGATGMGSARMSAAEMGDHLGHAATASRPLLRAGALSGCRTLSLLLRHGKGFSANVSAQYVCRLHGENS